MIYSATERTWAALFMVISASIFIGLNLIAMSDFRGTDQYWYMADTQTILDGGPKVSNGLYPFQILKHGGDYNSPFVHHTLNNYLVLPAARLLGAFRGWVVTNAVALIIAAILIARLIHKMSGWLPAGIGFAVFLLLPFTVWQSFQPLIEATITPFMALLIVSYALAGQKGNYWWGVSIAVSLLLLCRVSYILLIILFPPAYLRDNRPVGLNDILAVMKLSIPPILALLIRKYYFISSMLTTNIIPGKSDDLNLYLSATGSSLSLSDVLLKLKACLLYHIIPESTGLTVFIIPFNILLIFFIYRLYAVSFRTGKHRAAEEKGLARNSCASGYLTRTIELCVVLVLFHFVQGTIHQIQFRYFLTIAPALLCVAMVTMHEMKWFDNVPWKLVAVAVVLLVLSMMDASLAHHSSNEGWKESRMRDKICTILKWTVSSDDRIIGIADESFLYLKAEYCFRPARVLHVAPWYDREICDNLQREFHPNWIFCPKEAAIKNCFNVSDPPVKTEFPEPFSNWGLYRLK